ncbi:MAG: tetratricopeptide repeat protein [Cyanobacteria bacterium SZAS LIN-3]|nr:tetratricopeptide repeat protein [Cyanobacteria bacterium SZAS LIN-3]
MVKRKPAPLSCRLLLWLMILGGLWSDADPVRAEGRYKPETAVHMQAGVKLLRERQLVQARQEFETVVKMEPNIPDAYNNIGLTYFYENNVARAQQSYRKALDLEPMYGPALNNLGLILYSTGHPKDALYYWQQCLKVSTTSEPDLYYYIANALRDTGRKSEARENYLTAIKLNPNSAAAYSGLAALDLGENRLDDALAEVKKSIKLKSDSAFSYFHLGLIEERRNNPSAALVAYQNSLKYETVPKYAKETRSRIARLKAGESGDAGSGAGSAAADEVKARALAALNRHDWGTARAELEGLVKGPAAEDPIVWNNLGLALAGESQNSRAVEAYRKALLLRREGFAEAQYNLGMVLRHMGDNLGAEAAFRKAIDDSSRKGRSNPLSQNMLGIILRERGDFDAADKAFRRAIMQAGNDLPVAHYNRALLLEHNEHSRDAISEYHTYLELAPHGKNAAAAKIRLKRLTGT